MRQFIHLIHVAPANFAPPNSRRALSRHGPYRERAPKRDEIECDCECETVSGSNASNNMATV
jgi:hypothetical protein